MRKYGRAAVFIGLTTLGVAAFVALRPTAQSKESAKESALAHARTSIPKLPLTFEANRGQTDAAVKFVARGSGATMWLTGEEAVLGLSTDGKSATDVLRMSFVGAAKPETSGVLPQKTKSSYLRGGEKDIVGVPHFAEVVSKDLYPGVDLRWHGDRGKVEYDLVVAPQADASVVRVRFQGADSLSVRENGDLAVRMGARELVQTAPVAFQMNGGKREPVAAAFDVSGDEVSFRLDAYDRSRELVVDPSIDFSTYIGGTGDESANGVAVDSLLGDVVVVGGTSSIDFPSGFGHIPTAPKGSTDAYAVKFDPSMSYVKWSVYLAGSEYDEAWGVAIDQTNGRSWITGQTFSTNFPVVNPTQPARAGKWDGFVTAIEVLGDQVDFSTYLGGGGDDFPRAIAIGGLGVGSHVFITGFTESNTTFPILNPTQIGYGGGAYDAFLTVYYHDFPFAIQRSTFIGGSGDDRAYDVATIAADATSNPPATVDVIDDGSFESGGFGSWSSTDLSPTRIFSLSVQSNGFAFFVPPYNPFFTTAATDGTKAAVTGWGGSTPGTISLSQDVLIPATSDEGTLTFDYRAGWSILGTQDRTFGVEIQPLGGGAPVVSQTFLTTTHVPNEPPIVANFDGLPNGAAPQPYQGIYFAPADWNVFSPLVLHPVHSGTGGLLPTGGGAGSNFFSFTNKVVFDGAYVGGTAPQATLTTVQWKLYLSGVLVHTTPPKALTTTSTFYDSGNGTPGDAYIGAVDEVELISDRSRVAMDDVQYRTIGNPDTTSQSASYQVDLAPFAGTGCRVLFVWNVPEGNTGPAQFQLDNVHFYAAKGAVVVAGRTSSANFPRSNVFNPLGTTAQAKYGGGLADAFVVEYRRRGQAINWSTTYGGSGEDTAQGAAIAANGDVSFTGNTNSFDFPRVFALQPNRKGPDDAYLVKIRNGGSLIDVSTYFGGNGSDIGNAIQVNPLTGDLYVVGNTSSTTFPVSSDALQPALSFGNNTDAFVARFGEVTNGFGIQQPGFTKYASYFGGTGFERAKNVELTSGSTLFIVGDTNSSLDFPLFAPFSGAIGGASDGFLAKMDVSSVLYPARELQAEARSPESVALSWTTEPTDAQSFLIERTSSTGGKQEIATVPTSVTEYVDTGLSPDTSYSYSVSAVDKNGVKDAANSVQTSTPPYPPTAPSGLTAVADGSKVVLDWTDGSSNETGFEVQRAVVGELKTVSTVKAGVTHFETTDIVSEATGSSWRVVAVNRGGSAGSNVVVVSTEPTISVQQISGSILDSAKSGADRFAAAGRLTGLAGFDPNSQALRLELGDAASPVVLKIPAGDRGWTRRHGLLSWSSKRSFIGGARFTLDLNAKKGTYSLAVTGFDFPAAPGASVSVGFALGDQAGAVRTSWAVKGPGKLVLK